MNVRNLKSIDDTEWVEVKKQNGKSIAEVMQLNEKFVPVVTGMGLRDALYLLESSGMKVKVQGKGLVKKQSVEAGSILQKGQEIIIELS
jgi:cell division protein FtsI (penicillin-binding protein 3)